MSAAKAGRSPDAAALASAVDLLKLLTSLATGALVFSIGLVNRSGFVDTPLLKAVLVISWASLFVAVLAGVWAQSLVPNQVRHGSPDISAPALRNSTMVQEAFFIFGILGVAIALITSIVSMPAPVEAKIASPIAAVRTAAATLGLGSGAMYDKIDVVELLRGADPTRVEEQAWHVRFELRRGKSTISRDVYVDPVTGESM